MRRLLPKSLVGQTAAVLILGLIATHLLTIIIFEEHRRVVLNETEQQHIAQLVAAISDIILSVPDDDRELVARASESHSFRVSLVPITPSSVNVVDDPQSARLGELLKRRIQTAVDEPIQVEIGEAKPRDELSVNATIVEWLQTRLLRMATGHDQDTALLVSVPLPTGERIDFTTMLPLAAAPGWPKVVATTGIFVFAVLLLSVWTVRRLLLPVRVFADAATSFSQDVQAPSLPLTGPYELREAIGAFNEMQLRIRSQFEQRTQMLAAISHDLRTPLTVARLRAETIDESDVRERIVSSLAEMDQMLQTTLAFAREGTESESTSMTNLGALVEAICDDLAELEYDVTAAIPDGIILPCRPVALKRALTNLIENAIRYGTCAVVDVRSDAQAAEIVIADSGPGIPAKDLERVFLPFHRLDASRNRETGGLGLGLAIAKRIVESHGGQIRLSNRDVGGLEVRVSLPVHFTKELQDVK